MAEKSAEQLATIITVGKPVVIWRAKRPLTETKFLELQKRLQAAKEHSSVEIMLVPHAVDITVAQQAEQLANNKEPAKPNENKKAGSKDKEKDETIKVDGKGKEEPKPDEPDRPAK